MLSSKKLVLLKNIA